MGAAGLAALYAAMRQDPTPETPLPASPPATIEQALQKDEKQPDKKGRLDWKRTLERAVRSYQEPEEEELEHHDGPSPPPPSDLYQLLKSDLERICKQPVKMLYNDYLIEDRMTGDLYVLNTGESLTLRRVLDPVHPTVADQVVLNITTQDDGYLLESGETFLDDEAKKQPYLVIYGTLDEVQTKLAAFIELQDTIDAHDESAKQNQWNGLGWIIDNYRARFLAIQQVSWKYGIAIDPQAWAVLENIISQLEETVRNETARKVEENE